MPSTYTNILRLELQADGENDGTWGQIANDNVFALLEDAVAGTASISTTGGTTTLSTNNGTVDQARNKVLDITGSLGSDAIIEVPAQSKTYYVRNATSGAQTVEVLVAGQSAGAGIKVAQGKTQALYCDGSNVGQAGAAIAGTGETALLDSNLDANGGTILETSNIGKSIGDLPQYEDDGNGNAVVDFPNPPLVNGSKIGGGKSVGEPFALLDHLTGVGAPDNSGDTKFIRLTAGQNGTGGYNEGLLTNESVTGTAPLVVATAEIATGPLAGQVVHLWNTENRYPQPGESAGTVANDQMQQITGSFGDNTREGGIDYNANNSSSGLLATDGAFSVLSNGSNGAATGSGNSQTAEVGFNSANSPNARTGDYTNVKHEEVTYYVRIA